MLSNKTVWQMSKVSNVVQHNGVHRMTVVGFLFHLLISIEQLSQQEQRSMVSKLLMERPDLIIRNE